MNDKFLCLDLGNSRLKWAECQTNQLKIRRSDCSDYLKNISIEQFLNTSFRQMQSMPVWISSVGSGGYADKITAWFKEHWQVEPVYIKTSAEFKGLHNAYQQPSDLGVDRWLAMVAARSLLMTDFCLIDAGTALTIDVVDRSGQHQGGMILPGMQLMAEALNENTANIAIDGGSVSGLAVNTADAVMGGVSACFLGGVVRVLAEIRAQNPEIAVIITGGGADKLKSLDIKNAVFEKDLVLMGVCLVAQNSYA